MVYFKIITLLFLVYLEFKIFIVVSKNRNGSISLKYNYPTLKYCARKILNFKIVMTIENSRFFLQNSLITRVNKNYVFNVIESGIFSKKDFFRQNLKNLTKRPKSFLIFFRFVVRQKNKQK